MITRKRWRSLLLKRPAEWLDLTRTIGAGVPTLARADGVGALQFTIARYARGPSPRATLDDLSGMLDELVAALGLARPFARASRARPRPLVGASFRWGSNFLRVWYVTDGQSFAKVTYVCDWSHRGPELREVERIVRGLEFSRARAPKS